MGKKKKEVVEKINVSRKPKMINVKFKNFAKVWWKSYTPGQVVEFESISWFERLVSIVE